MDRDLIELMRRREALLELRASDPAQKDPADVGAADVGAADVGTADVDAADRVASELQAVTAALKDGLGGQDLRIRSLSLDSDRELVSRLGALESIHPLSDPKDLGELADRLAPDRRCFVLEHPGLAGHPLNVVWVALTVDAPRSIAGVLGSGRRRFDPAEADTAVFYSIWNVERGLSGIPGGAALLGLAMDHIRGDLPQVQSFVTLSPIPGFRKWASTNTDLQGEESNSELMGFCARYLTERDSTGRLTDPVARFHMRNGARLWRINWQGDPSSRGIERAWGLMANYRYAPEDRDANKSALAQGSPAVGTEVASLLEEFGD